MKKVMFFIIASVMYSTLGASTGSFKRDELGFVNINTDSKDLIGSKNRDSSNFDLKVGFVESLLEIQSKDQKNSNFLDAVAIWVSYRF